MATLIEAKRARIDTDTLTRPPDEDPSKYRLKSLQFFSLGSLVVMAYWPLYNLIDWYLVGQLGINTWVALGMTFVILLPFWQLVFALKNRSSASALRDLFRFHSLCPSCLFSLREISPAPDGCTLCPECGAAWRLPAQKPGP